MVCLVCGAWDQDKPVQRPAAGETDSQGFAPHSWHRPSPMPTPKKSPEKRPAEEAAAAEETPSKKAKVTPKVCGSPSAACAPQ